MAPAFTTKRSVEGTLTFPDDVKGKVVVIRFWADWCPYCKGEMKDINDVYRRHRELGLELLAINTGQSHAKVNAFIRELDITYPALMDEDTLISKRYGVAGLPTTFIIGRNGVVQDKLLGEVENATFERKVLAVLR